VDLPDATTQPQDGKSLVPAALFGVSLLAVPLATFAIARFDLEHVGVRAAGRYSVPFGEKLPAVGPSTQHGGLSDLQPFPYLFAQFDRPAAWITVGTVAVALILARFLRRSSVERVIRWISEHGLMSAALTFVLLAAAAPWSCRRYPLALDEYAAVFQSQIFSTGHIFARYPPAFATRLVPLPC
jgi:hypothetical protein